MAYSYTFLNSIENKIKRIIISVEFYCYNKFTQPNL